MYIVCKYLYMQTGLFIYLCRRINRIRIYNLASINKSPRYENLPFLLLCGEDTINQKHLFKGIIQSKPFPLMTILKWLKPELLLLIFCPVEREAEFQERRRPLLSFVARIMCFLRCFLHENREFRSINPSW